MFYFPPSEPAALSTSQWLKKKYLAHDPWQRWRDIPNLMQFDQILGQLRENASDQLIEVDCSTCYETMDQFPSEIIPFSVKSLVNDITHCTYPVFLIKGPPGMGKSHLMANLCRYWALGFGMREYTLVFRVNMAALQQPPKTVKDLLRGVLPRSQNTAHLQRWIERRNGQGTVFILEGWNYRLGMRLPKNSLVIGTSYTLSKFPMEWLTFTFTDPKPPQTKRWGMYAGTPLPGNYERQSRKKRTYTQFDIILALTPSQISKQVTHYHSTDPLKAEAVLLHLASNPDIKQLTSIPVYLYAILFISDHVSPSDLPDTWTEMFALLTLLQFQQQVILPEHMSDFCENLPREISSHFCKRAFSELMSREDPSPGFLNFTFPLLKHFLAAVRIHQLSVSKQIQLMKQHQQMNFIWLFYAGLSHFPNLNILRTLNQQDPLYVINWFYEAGYTMTLPCSYKIENIILTASDIHHILTQCGGELKSLTFHKCCLGTEALTQLSKLSAYSHSTQVMERIQLR